MQGVVSGQYCEKHGIEKTQWNKDPRKSAGGCWQCRVCRREALARQNAKPEVKQHNRPGGKYYASNRESMWRHNGIVGLTYEHYQSQATHCRICGATEKLVPDHDHTTKQFRGVLCNNCNTGLGMFRDNPQFLRCAELYLGGQPCH